MMYSKLLLVLLSPILLVQNSMGNPIPAAVETEASTEKPQAQLIIYVSKKLMDMGESILKSSKAVLQDVVDELSVIENNDEKVTELLEVSKKLIADIKELDNRDDSEKMQDIFSFMGTLQKLTGRYSLQYEEPIIVNKQFQESLKKHGLSDLKKEYDNKFEEFSKDLVAETNKVPDAMVLEGWPDRNSYIDW